MQPTTQPTTPPTTQPTTSSNTCPQSVTPGPCNYELPLEVLKRCIVSYKPVCFKAGGFFLGPPSDAKPLIIIF